MFELETTFTGLAGHYTQDQTLVSALWQELEGHYTEAGRHYHGPGHLENLLRTLSTVKAQLEDPEAVWFALFYHDAIYDVQRTDNEERSAKLAVKRLEQIGFPAERAERCRRHILATKGHTVSDDSDTNLFTDADLAILGSDWSTYEAYYRAIRLEYSVYPDAIYDEGRRKVLEHFLGMRCLYKNNFFRDRYEQQAFSNLKKELTVLLNLKK